MRPRILPAQLEPTRRYLPLQRAASRQENPNRQKSRLGYPRYFENTPEGLLGVDPPGPVLTTTA